jgi:quercetin dioxygenase-like cupin family protein
LSIFNVGGAALPTTDSHAHEFFYASYCERIAESDGEEKLIRKGDAFLLNPDNLHIVKNTGSSKL